jgi:tRNA uridine 5-carbamoylmethylation protein Kti12
MLVGIPGSGKSTWIKNQDFGDAIVASSDDYIERVAAESGKTYNEVFSRAIGHAQKFCDAQVQTAINLDKTLIWDQTNTTAKGRKIKLGRVPKEWRKICVFFATPKPDELKRRLDSRVGKSIPKNVMNTMINTLEIPDLSEGWDEIIWA